MQPVRSWLAIGASILAVSLSTSAQVRAQAAATFVSPTGDNDNNCQTPATPCRQLRGATGAIAKTFPGAVIHVLAGDYAQFTVDKSVEIIVDGGHASITTGAETIPGGDELAEILVNAGPADEVRIRGFFLDTAVFGSGVSSSSGLAFVAGGALHLEDCAIVSAGASFGVVFAPTGASELYVSNCAISGNGSASAGGGIQVRPTGQGSADIVLDNVRVENNRTGIVIDGRTTTGSNNVTVRNSTIGGSSAFGLNAIDSGGGSTDVMIEGSSLSNNGSQGVVANGANTRVRMRDSTVSGNATGLIAIAGGSLISHGGNVVAGNTANGAFTQTVGQQ